MNRTQHRTRTNRMRALARDLHSPIEPAGDREDPPRVRNYYMKVNGGYVLLACAERPDAHTRAKLEKQARFSKVVAEPKAAPSAGRKLQMPVGFTAALLAGFGMGQITVRRRTDRQKVG